MMMTHQPSVGEFAFWHECLRQLRKGVGKVQVEWGVRVMVVGDSMPHIGRDCTCDDHVGLQEVDTSLDLKMTKVESLDLRGGRLVFTQSKNKELGDIPICTFHEIDYVDGCQ